MDTLARSEEVAMEFLTDFLPDHFIKPVPRDGLCILNAFRENLSSIDQEETVESIAAALRIELEKDAYKNAVVEGTDLLGGRVGGGRVL